MENRILLESGHNRLVKGRYGYVLYNKHDIAIGKMIEAYGEYFESEVELFRQLCRPGQVVLDVGANIGTHALAFAQLVGPAGRVCAFEAQRIIHQMLCANAAINGLMNLECIHAAVGAQAGEVHLGEPRMDVAQNFGGFSVDQTRGAIKTPLIALDGWLDVPSVHLIKIDVEGMELDVLRGATGLIGKHRPGLYVENDRPEKSASLFEYIRSLGYRIYWHLPPDFNPNNFFGNPNRLFAQGLIDRGGEFLESIGFAINILCIPDHISVQLNGFREMTDIQEHPLKREYSKAFAAT